MSDVTESITKSFGESIIKNASDAGVDTVEVMLDSFVQDEILRSIPIVKYAIAAYKIVDDIKGRYFLRKLQIFINSFNTGNATEADVRKRQAEFADGNRDMELEYITIIVDRYLDLEKPAILAKLYLAYLDEIVTWDEFCSYSEVINTVLKCDIKYLIDKEEYIVSNNIVAAELLRLSSTGLMSSYQNDSPFSSDGQGGIAILASSFDRVKTKERIFSRTAFGQKLVNIINAG